MLDLGDHEQEEAWGERVTVEVSPEMKFTVEIRSIEKGTDDGSIPIGSF